MIRHICGADNGGSFVKYCSHLSHFLLLISTFSTECFASMWLSKNAWAVASNSHSVQEKLYLPLWVFMCSSRTFLSIALYSHFLQYIIPGDTFYPTVRSPTGDPGWLIKTHAHVVFSLYNKITRVTSRRSDSRVKVITKKCLVERKKFVKKNCQKQFHKKRFEKIFSQNKFW